MTTAGSRRNLLSKEKGIQNKLTMSSNNPGLGPGKLEARIGAQQCNPDSSKETLPRKAHNFLTFLKLWRSWEQLLYYMPCSKMHY